MIPAAVRHRPTRTDLSLLLLFLSWPVCLVHRFWNNKPPNKVSWFMTGEIKQDVQYYIYDTGNMLSTTFILLSFVLIQKKTTNYNITLLAVFLISIIDIIHYWLCYKQNEWVVTLEGLIMLLAALLILRKWNKG
jgi:hypothetical protein